MAKRASSDDYDKIKKNIVKKLYAHHAFVKGHLLYERLMSGIPAHLKGFVGDVLLDLMKEELVVLYGKTKYGDAYQLNIDKLREIEEIIFGL